MPRTSTRTFTPEIDAIVMGVFHRDKGNNCALIAVDEIRSKTKKVFSENDVNRRAIELGLTKPRKSTFFWSPEEDAFLTKHIAVPPAQLHQSFNKAFPDSPRTLSAIVARIGRIGGVRELLFANGYNATELSKHLHIGKPAIEKMTQAGIIHGTKPNGRDWHYTKEEIRRFIAKHPEQIDITKVDKYWLIGILTFDLKEDDHAKSGRTSAAVCSTRT